METMSENYMSWIWTCIDHLSTMNQTRVLSAKKKLTFYLIIEYRKFQKNEFSNWHVLDSNVCPPYEQHSLISLNKCVRIEPAISTLAPWLYISKHSIENSILHSHREDE